MYRTYCTLSHVQYVLWYMYEIPTRVIDESATERDQSDEASDM